MGNCGNPPAGPLYSVRQEWDDSLGAAVWGIVLRDGQGKERYLRDLSTSEDFVRRLACLFCEQKLEAVHFSEAVEDFLACPDQLEKADGKGPVRL